MTLSLIPVTSGVAPHQGHKPKPQLHAEPMVEPKATVISLAALELAVKSRKLDALLGVLESSASSNYKERAIIRVEEMGTGGNASHAYQVLDYTVRKSDRGSPFIALLNKSAILIADSYYDTNFRR